MSNHLGVVAAAFLLLWAPAGWGAVRCEQGGSRLQTREGRERLAYVLQTLDQERRPARNWVGGFGGGFALGILLQVGAAGAFPKEQQINYWVGAAGMGVGFLSISVGALRSLANDAPLRAPEEGTGSDDEVCRVLAEAEGRLRDGANGEALASGALAQVANVLINVGLFLWLGLGYHHWGNAGLNLGAGLAIGEGLILTQPHGLPEAWRRYSLGTF